MEFPYISQINVDNCYSHQDFSIPKENLKDFRHIIITGKNGSGKTTILERISALLDIESKGQSKENLIAHYRMRLGNGMRGPIGGASRDGLSFDDKIRQLQDVSLNFLADRSYFKENKENYILSFFKANRVVMLNDVKSVVNEDAFYKQIKGHSGNPEAFITHLKQFLVNKKVYEAFDYMNANQTGLARSKSFFSSLTDILRTIFKDQALEIEFSQDNFEFYLLLEGKRKTTFNQLPAGYSSFLNILMVILMQVDLIRKSVGNHSIEPVGIVIIDEPENHFHLSMQYEILPLLTTLFPKIQLIVATHSPAIISSLEHAVIYDISSKSEVADWVLGSSYSELMIKHFGLENEYSDIADKIITDVNNAVKANDLEQLKTILETKDKYLTPSLRLEIESQIIKSKYPV